jgi:hypothetical protein
MVERCTFTTKKGRCSRIARWTWEDDKMKVHRLCTQHRDKMVPQEARTIDALPKCYGNVNFLACTCGRYTCSFKRVHTVKTSPLINKGRGFKA